MLGVHGAEQAAGAGIGHLARARWHGWAGEARVRRQLCSNVSRMAAKSGSWRVPEGPGRDAALLVQLNERPSPSLKRARAAGQKMVLKGVPLGVQK